MYFTNKQLPWPSIDTFLNTGTGSVLARTMWVFLESGASSILAETLLSEISGLWTLDFELKLAVELINPQKKNFPSINRIVAPIFFFPSTPFIYHGYEMMQDQDKSNGRQRRILDGNHGFTGASGLVRF